MSDKQNLFYSSISKYYSDIFPYNPAQLKFVQNNLCELEDKKILDIGCATGELAYQLAENGACVTAIDLNEDLLQQAHNTKKHNKLTFQKGNMLELETDFQPADFDSVLCFGNTLVHLQSAELVHKMLSAVYAVLKPGGKLLLQILNYDYILKEQIGSLPLIETEKITFIRNYSFGDSELINFKTELEIKNENKMVSNETPLLALGSKTLLSILELAGFKNAQLYSNFKQDDFGGKHLPLVLSCEK